MGDWYDGPANKTIGEAFASCTKMPPRPDNPKWDNNKPVFTNSELGSIYELITEADRIMHTHSAGQCFVWNYVNQPREEGFRQFTYRSLDGWGRISIQCRRVDELIDGSGSRMYCGNWRDKAHEKGARTLNGETLVLLDHANSYCYGADAITQREIEAMYNNVAVWWEGLPRVILPKATAEELARKIEYR